MAAEQKETFRIGGTTYAVHPVPQAQWSDNAAETVRLLAEYGIPAMVQDGTLEANTGGVTTTVLGQGGTLRDGSVAVHNEADVPPRLLAAHEMYHSARRLATSEASAFLDAILDQLDYTSERTKKYLDFIADTYWGNAFDMMTNAEGIMEEFAAAISGSNLD